MSQSYPEAVEEDSIIPAEANRIDNVLITHYCICEICCGKPVNHPAYGITASGRYAVPYYSVAVDPSVIPLGSRVFVDYGYGIYEYRADDTGSGVKGNHIDICVTAHEEARNLGTEIVTVYYIKE